MAGEPLELDLGHIRLPDGGVAHCTALVTVSLAIDGIKRGDEGMVLEDLLRPILQRLIDRLGGSLVWYAALHPGEDLDGDADDPEAKCSPRTPTMMTRRRGADGSGRRRSSRGW